MTTSTLVGLFPLVSIWTAGCGPARAQSEVAPVADSRPSCTGRDDAVTLLRGLPNWTAEGLQGEQVAILVSTAQRLTSIDLPCVRSAFEIVGRDIQTGLDTQTAFRLFVFMRVLFRVPPRDDVTKRARFGGFMRPDFGTGLEGEYRASWPVVLREDRVVAVEPQLGYSGLPWRMLAEFDFLSRTYGLRYSANANVLASPPPTVAPPSSGTPIPSNSAGP